jgi:DNA-binding transcriptional LysR family regulator
VLPEVFSKYTALYPNVQLHVDRSYGSKVVQAVQDNLADFGITQLPVEEKRLQVVKVHSDEIRLIAPPNHPLARLGAVTAQDMRGFPLLLPKSGTTRTKLNAWLEPVEDEIQVSMELDSTEMIKRFVMAGLGLSFLAGSHSAGEVFSGKLASLPLAPDPILRDLGLIYRKDKSLSRAALGFIDVVLEQAGGINRFEAGRALAPVAIRTSPEAKVGQRH